MKRILFGLLFAGSAAYAGTPLWTFTALTATSISLPATGTATIQYQMTNQSSKPHTLAMGSIPGITQDTSAGHCAAPFTLGSQQSCILTLTVDGSAVQGNIVGGPVICQEGSALQCYQPSPENALNITLTNSPTTALSASVSVLALEISHNPRMITITNTGSTTAENLSINYQGFPSGTSGGSTCGSTLNPAASCIITITPGSSATSDCNAGQGSAPVPGVVTASASNATSVNTNVVVLTYGCIYQEGYIFSIDDTTSTNMSISGKTASLADISSSIQWYNGSSISTGATSLNDGATNTQAIITAQGAGSYAASLCTNYTIDSSGNSPCSAGTCYNNWYLPAICQLGAAGEGAGCSGSTDNMVGNLANLISGCTGSACLAGQHWGSSEYTASPASAAWTEDFDPSGSHQYIDSKPGMFAVRCSRDLTS